METISLSEVRAIIDSKDPYGYPVSFCLEVWSCNKSKGTGGELIKVERAVKNHSLMNAQKYGNKVRMKPNVGITAGVSALVEKHATEQTTVISLMGKDELSNKYKPTGERMTIHYRLIETFNNKKVEW